MPMHAHLRATIDRYWLYAYLSGKYARRGDVPKLLYVQQTIFRAHLEVLRALHPAVAALTGVARRLHWGRRCGRRRERPPRRRRRERRQVRIGYNTWSMATVPYQVFLPRLAEIGYTSLAISVVPGYGIGGTWTPNAAALDALSADDRRRIKEGCESRGLELAAVVGNQPVIEDDPERSRAALARLRQTIDFCAEVALRDGGVPTLNTGSGGAPAAFATHREQLVERLGQLADYAAGKGVTVCVEPHVGAAIDTPERSEWLVRAVDHPNLRLDFDVSHFEVVGIPMADSVPRLVPLSASVEIKDQHLRYLDQPEPAGWRVAGNGAGKAVAPDGREVEYQFLLGGEGDFDLPGYLRLMRAAGWSGAVGFEASVQCQARPGYDALREAERTYRWMAAGWERAGIPAA